MLTREEFLDNVKRLTDAAAAYYADSKLLMSDAEYDMLLDKVEEARVHNGWGEADQLLDAVAAGNAGKADVVHVKPMLSMAKVKTITDVEKFIKKVGTYTLEPKLDGLAVSLTYVEGVLTVAATRGDGLRGENITGQVIKNSITNLPHNLVEKVDLNVRGELFMTHKNFIEANKHRVKLTGKPFANSRNATAGIIRNEKDEPYATLSFVAYDSVGLEGEDYTHQLEHLRKFGFITSVDLTPELVGSVSEKVAQFGDMRESLDYPVDGIVVKAVSEKVRIELGEGSKTPNWAVAYKYSDEQAVTILRDIERAVGKTGAISYVAVFDPVELEGTTVTKATLNNAQYISDRNIKVGCEVVIVKSNMIIPQVLGGVNNNDCEEYIAPLTCPKCGEALDTVSSVVWRCLNPECSVLQSLITFTGRDFMNIEGLSEATLSRLLDEGMISDAADLYGLTVKGLSNLQMESGAKSVKQYQLLGEKTAIKIVNEIQKSKTSDLGRVLSSLNVRHLGRRLGKRLAEHFHTMQAVQEASVEDLMKVEGIAKDKAEVIYEGLQKREGLISKLKKAGVNMGDRADAEKGTVTPEGLKFLVGKTFCLTGAASIPRSELSSMLESYGAKAQSGVSSKTDYLITGESAGSKYDKAVKLGVNILNVEEIIKHIK